MWSSQRFILAQCWFKRLRMDQYSSNTARQTSRCSSVIGRILLRPMRLKSLRTALPSLDSNDCHSTSGSSVRNGKEGLVCDFRALFRTFSSSDSDSSSDECVSESSDAEASESESVFVSLSSSSSSSSSLLLLSSSIALCTSSSG